ncbi:MAG TPA: hypothetical protein VKZ96_12365 [Thermomicrobiales bacterium]|nr:hypothetical protein [Thermomicrobiales bacterium]
MVRKNALEWSIFAVSGVLLLLVFGYLGYHALTSEDEPAEIEIEVGVAHPQGGRYILPVSLHNRGGQSVEDVEIEISLLQGGVTTETAAITMPFLPRLSTREGSVFFDSDPAQADEIETLVIGYIVP